MVSRENTVIIACGALALLLAYTIFLFTTWPDWVGIGVLIVVGVVVPQLLTNRIDRTSS